MKKHFFIFLTLSFFASQANAQAFEMVEKSWDISATNIDSAKVLCTQGYYLAKDKSDIKTMGRALSYKAIYYDIEGKSDSALFLFYKALDIQESIKDTAGLITTYNNLGIFHFSQYQYSLALSYYKKAYNEAILIKDYSSAAGSLVNMGIIESYEEGGGDALNYYDQATRLYLLSADTLALQPIWSNTAKVYFDKGEYEKAYEFNLKSIKSPDENKTLGGWISERILMTNIMVKMRKFTIAEEYAMEALTEAEKNGLPERRQYLYEALANLYFQKQDYKKAYEFSTRYRDLRDSLVNDVKAAQIAKMETENKVEKTLNDLTRAKLDQEKYKNEVLEKQRFQIRLYSIIIVAGIGLIILAVLILLLINNLRLEKVNSQLLNDKKLHTEALLEKEKILMRESHHRIKNNLQLINSILDLQSRNIKDPSVKKAFTESRQRIQAISFAHQRLYGNDTVEKLNLKSFLNDLTQSIQSSGLETNSGIHIIADIEDIATSTEKAVPIGLIVNELLTNSIKYAFPNGKPGEIKINLRSISSGLELVIEDNGKGMTEEIQGTGFGHQLVKSMTRQLKAEYLLSLDSGVRHVFIIPGI